MKNVTMSVEKDILTIKVDLSKKGSPSASGKSMVIASTEGNQPISPGKETYIGLNVYSKR